MIMIWEFTQPYSDALSAFLTEREGDIFCARRGGRSAQSNFFASVDRVTGEQRARG